MKLSELQNILRDLAIKAGPDNDPEVYFVKYPHYLDRPRKVSKVYLDSERDIMLSND